MMKLKIVLLTVCLLSTLNCRLLSPAHSGDKEYYEFSDMQGDANAHIEKFSSYPIEKQIDMFLFAECCVEGGAGNLRSYFRRDGAEKIPNIVKRIETFPNAIEDNNSLIGELFVINRECNCMKSHPEYLKSLTLAGEIARAAKISPEDNPHDKYRADYIKMYDDMLEEIRKQYQTKLQD